MSEDEAGGRVFEVADAAGEVRRYAEADFDEVYPTSDEPEMRRLVGLGWLLLDEGVRRDDGAGAAWLDALLRRAAGRVLPAAADPAAAESRDAAYYVLGHLKAGATGRPPA